MDLGVSGGQRRLQLRDEGAAIECRRTDYGYGGRQLLRERPPVDDVALPDDAGYGVPPCRVRVSARRISALTGGAKARYIVGGREIHRLSIV